MAGGGFGAYKQGHDTILECYADAHPHNMLIQYDL